MSKLRPSTVTTGSRFMLPVYPLAALYIAGVFIFADAARTSSPSFQAAKDVMPIQHWGFIFATLGVCLALALVVGNRNVMAVALLFGTVLYFWWAGQLFRSTLLSPDASATGWVYTAGWAWAHLASTWSVATDRPEQ